MRADLVAGDFTSVPGQAFQIVIEVGNALDVIDGIRARVLGLDPAWVTGEPDYVALFPDTSERLSLHVRLPDTFPAGAHPLQIEVRSETDPTDVVVLDAHLDVVAVTAPAIEIAPRQVKARRRAEFEVVCSNAGNSTIAMSLLAFDAEQELSLTFHPTAVDIPAGGSTNALLEAQARRRWFGGQANRTITVRGVTSAQQVEARTSFLQKPMIPSGAATVAILTLVMALWALAFLFGIDRLMANEPAVSKAAPFSLYTPGAGAGRALDISAVGGTASGLVVGPTGVPVERATITAVRDTPDGLVEMSSAATDADGMFVVGPLIPGSYYLRLTGDGFDAAIFYPGASSPAGAEAVTTSADADVAVDDFVVAGRPGSITGVIDTGGTGSLAGVSVEVFSVVDGVVQGSVQAATTDDAGRYTFTGLETPASYELVVSSTDAAFGEVRTRLVLAAGEDVTANTISLTAATGSLRGKVTNGTTLLGGVEVVASFNGTDYETTTPTVGDVGSYVLEGLPAPGTYLLTFSLDGAGEETLVVDIDAGEDKVLDVVIARQPIDLLGVVEGRDGPDQPYVALDDATIHVQGDGVDISAASDSSGLFTIPGLQPDVPLQVTVARDGYFSRTLTVTPSTSSAHLATLDDDGRVPFRLERTTRTVTGVVVDSDGNGRPGVEVELTDGATPLTITTATSPAGQFTFTNVPFGSYSLTVKLDPTTTVLVEIDADSTATVTLPDIVADGASG